MERWLVLLSQHNLQQLSSIFDNSRSTNDAGEVGHCLLHVVIDMSAVAHIIQPRFLHIGPGASKLLTPILKHASIQNPLIVTDSFLASSGIVSTVLQANNLSAPVFSRCVPDPTTDSVDALVSAINDSHHDGVIAIGGGSPIDTAKAACIMAKFGGVMSDYKVPFNIEREGVPLIAIPTTAGTGSEVTKFTVVTDTQSNEKMLCAGSAYVPYAALVDYELTMQKPWRLTADTALDSLTHAIESFVSAKRNAFTMPLSIAAMSSICQHVLTACEEPQNRAARGSLMLAATQAGLAFSNSSVALVHAMSRPIGAHFHIPHGLSNAMLLPRIVEWSIPGAKELYAEVAFATGAASPDVVDDLDEACRHLVMGLQLLNSKLKVPTLKESKIAEDRFMSLVPIMAQQAVASGSHLNNPRVPSESEIEDLYVEIYNSKPIADDFEI